MEAGIHRILFGWENLMTLGELIREGLSWLARMVREEPQKDKEARNFVDAVIDSRAIASQIARFKGDLLDRIEDQLRASLASMPPADALSFNLVWRGKVRRAATPGLPPSLEYVGVLIAFMREKEYDGYAVDSFVTPRVMHIIEEAIVEFYQKPDVSQAIAAGLIDQLKTLSVVEDHVRVELGEQQRFLSKELSGVMKANLGGLVTSDVATRLGQNVHVFLQSTTGKTLLSTVGKLLATGTGKILITKIALVVSHVVSSAAFHAALVATVKKIGITVLVKTVIGKVLIAILAILGVSAGIPVVWIVAPLVVAILAYEYKNLPGKLADKVPGEVAGVLRDKFDEMNQEIVKEIAVGVIAQAAAEGDHASGAA